MTGSDRPHPDDTTDEETPMATTDPTDVLTTRSTAVEPPLPYGTGAWTTGAEPGFGVDAVAPTPSTEVAAAERSRGGSPVLAVSGFLAVGTAVWALVGAPAVGGAVVLTAGVLLAVVLGLVLIFRR